MSFGRRKIPSLILFTLLLTLVFLVVTSLLMSVSHNFSEVNDLEQFRVIGTDAAFKGNGLTLSSACLSRQTLNSGDVKLYSNRLPSKQYFLTIGIPTIARTIGNQYLMQTLNSLTTNQTLDTSKPDILIVVQLGDSNKQKRLKLAAEIKGKHADLINSGLLDIIQVYPSYYPSFNNLKRRFGDKEERVKWRSKQVIDFSFLSCYCYGLGKYHLQLEDDVIASPYYYLKLRDFIANYEAKEKWFTLDASVLGYIGKVYHNHDLNEIASFYYIFFDEMPVDWLEYTWREIKGQTNRWKLRTASLFQHIGTVSSLKNKKQIAKEPYFDDHKQKFLGLNPPTKLFTNLKAERNTVIKSAYEKGSGYFWGSCHDDRKCMIRMVFEKGIPVQRVVVETGANIALNDTIHHGSLEAGTYLNGNECVHYYKTGATQFRKGTLDVVFPQPTTVNCLKIVIKNQQEWVFVREINIWGTK